MRLVVIPARGGSKRIPKKNIRLFCGKPILAYSIAAARESELFDRIIVSTDCEEIAAVANHYGAEVPFLRPEELSDDHCGVVAVVKHAAQWCRERGEEIEAVCGIYATAPLIEVADLHRGFELLQTSGADSVLAVTTFASPIQRALKMNDNGDLAMFNPEHAMTRSQDLAPAYHDAAQFFWWGKDYAGSGQPVNKGLVLPRSRVQDIDTEEDWQVAEQLYRLLHPEVVDA